MGVRLAQVAVYVAVQHHAKLSGAMNQGGRPARKHKDQKPAHAGCIEIASRTPQGMSAVLVTRDEAQLQHWYNCRYRLAERSGYGSAVAP